MNSTFKPALLLMGGRAAGVAVGFFIPLVLVRLFSQAEFGMYKQVFLVYATLYGIAQVGMAESLFYFLPNAGRRGGRFAANALSGLMVAGTVVLAAMVGFGPMLARWMGSGQLGIPMALMGVYLLLMLTAAVLEISMITGQRYRLAAGTYSVSDLARAALYLLPLLISPTLEALLAGAIAFAVLRVIATFVFLSRQFGRELRPDAGLMRDQLAYAGPFALAVVLQILQSNLHNYAVSWKFDSASFAIYSVGCLQIPLIDLVFSSASHVMMVRMGRARSEGRLEEAHAIWTDTTRKLALVFFPLVCLLLVSARDLITFLFTPAYAASVPIFMVWSLTILASAFQVDGVLRVFARTRFIFVMHGLTLILVLALIVPMMSTFGMVGAAMVSLIATFAAKGLGLLRIRSVMRQPLRTFMPWRSLATTLALSLIAAVPAWIVAAESVSLPPFIALTLIAAVYVLAYAVLGLVCGVITPAERQALLAPLRRLMPVSPQPEESRAP